MFADTHRSIAHERFAVWCAPFFTVLTAIGFLWLSHFYHPVAAHVPASTLAAFYHAHHLAVEIGMSLFALSCGFLAVYTVELTLILWRREAAPLMSLGQLLGGFGVVMLIFISCCLWIAAAYRAGHTAPSVTESLNDVSWFGFLVGWVILALQMICAGVVVLSDDTQARFAPRWVRGATIVAALVLATANGCAFTKSGVLGWNGLLGFYVPMLIWGVWLNGFAVLAARDVRRRRSLIGVFPRPAPAVAVPELVK
jgi:hypothetical protein